MVFNLILFSLLAIFQTALAAFGVTSNGNSFRVDTAGGLVFDVNKYEDYKTCMKSQLTPAEQMEI
jgi:uncharacterized protein YabE (DUF348 family)